jgi:putative DNA primase/helicase
MRLDDLLTRLKRIRRSGRGYVALCPAHDDRHQSLSITQHDNRILLHCFRDCSVESICDALNIRVRDLFECNANDTRPGWTDEQRRLYAYDKLWRPALPTRGTIAEQYLRNRGITIPIPPALRFFPSLPHRDYGWSFPALVAAIQDANGKFAGVTVAWLCADGSDKAPVEPTRKIYGPYHGSAVRLSPASNILAIAEGIETALSVRQACPELPVWAALSAQNLPHIEIPEGVSELIICADADPPGEAAANQSAQRLMTKGYEVKIARPKRDGADFNDLRL